MHTISAGYLAYLLYVSNKSFWCLIDDEAVCAKTSVNVALKGTWHVPVAAFFVIFWNQDLSMSEIRLGYKRVIFIWVDMGLGSLISEYSLTPDA